MVGNEGKTRIPVYETLTQAGFDPERDMLQVPVMDPEAYGHANFWAGMPVPQWRQWGGGGLLVDWDLRPACRGCTRRAARSTARGRTPARRRAGATRAGRRAAAARAAPEPVIDDGQVQGEKAAGLRPAAARRRAASAGRS